MNVTTLQLGIYRDGDNNLDQIQATRLRFERQAAYGKRCDPRRRRRSRRPCRPRFPALAAALLSS
jgi:hypothetical protein